MGSGEVMHPAHGPVVSDGPALLDRYLEHRARREASLVRALSPEPASEASLVRRVYADVAEELLPVAARSLRAGLDKLSEEESAKEVATGLWRSLEKR